MSTYVWVALIPTAISIALGVLSWPRRDRPGAGAFCALMVTLTLWSGGYALELMPSGLPWKILAAKIQYLGIPTASAAWLLVALSYTHSLRGISRRALVGLLTIPVVTVVLAWTNELHGLIWAQTGLYEQGSLSVAVFSYGPWFAVNVAYSYALMLMASALFLRTLMILPVYDRQSLGLVISALLPWMANLAHVTGLSPLYPLDLTPFAFVLGGAGIALSLKRYRFLDLAPVARAEVVDCLRDAVLVVDLEGRVIDLNPAAHLVIGPRGGEILGTPLNDLFPDVPALLEAIQSEGETTGEILIGREPNQRRYGMHVAPIRETGGGLCGRLVDLHDITDLRDAEARVQYLALRDPLTGLPNRQLFRDRFDRALSLARRQRTQVACLFLDLDDFKKINDHYGHSIGDDLLREASARIRSALRDVDTVVRPAEVADGDGSGEATLARFGGDEFVILLQGLEHASDANVAADRVVQSLRSPFRLGQSLVAVRTSVGVSVWPNDGDNVEVLLRNADAAMYEAKRRGGDNVCFFTRSINERARARVEIESGLHRALETQALSLEYQPAFDVETGRIVALEAVLRWEHPTRGRIEPSDFLPVIEDSGLAVEFGFRILRRAACDWRRARTHLDGARLSLHLSARQIAHPGFVAKVLEIIGEEGLSPRELEFEITEEALIRDPDRSLEVLGRLRERGMRLAIDDFGTGLSSLSHLRSLALDRVKIDASFTARIDDPTYAALIRAIIALSHELGLESTSEGVETREQLDFLRAEGCDRVQGDLLGRPQPLEATIELARRHHSWPHRLRETA